jgi:hypothetical protein
LNQASKKKTTTPISASTAPKAIRNTCTAVMVRPGVSSYRLAG